MRKGANEILNVPVHRMGCFFFFSFFLGGGGATPGIPRLSDSPRNFHSLVTHATTLCTVVYTPTPRQLDQSLDLRPLSPDETDSSPPPPQINFRVLSCVRGTDVPVLRKGDGVGFPDSSRK